MKLKKIKGLLIACLSCIMLGATGCWVENGWSDTGSSSTGSSEYGSSDTGSSDTGSSDTGSSDTGSSDTGSSDTGSSDTGSSDTGSSDSGETKTTYTVNYETNGAGTVNSVEWDPTTAFTLPTGLTKYRYRFNGWFYDTACTQEVDESVPALFDGITLYAGWTQVYEVRLYTSEWEYTQRWYAEGETVDVSAWGEPTGEFEGEEVTFTHWEDELLENTVSANFKMPAKSMAFYAQYNTPQLFAWSWDKTTNVYTSTGAGVRPIKNVGGYYGTYSADIVVVNRSTTGIGLIFNAYVPTDVNKPYDYNTDCEYWYMHVNPTTSGGYQLAYVSKATGYGVQTSCSLTSAPQVWQTKFDEFKNKGTQTLEMNFKIVYTPTAITCYIDNQKVMEYTGELLNKAFNKGVGIRTNAQDNVVKNVTFTPSAEYPDSEVHTITLNANGVGSNDKMLYAEGTTLKLPKLSTSGYRFDGWYTDAACKTAVAKDFAPDANVTLYAKWSQATSTSNGYNIYADGSYTSAQTSGYAVVNVPGKTGKYGLWEADVTIDQTSVNSKFGLIMHSDVKASADQVTFSGANCYYLYHNASANENFTIASEVNGAYTTFSGHKKYVDGNGAFNLASSNAAYDEVLAYYNANKALKAGTLDSYTFRLGVEILPDAINLYVGGKLFLNYTNSAGLGKFDSVDGCTGMGFAAEKANTTFSNYKWTEAEVEEDTEDVVISNFTVKDGAWTSNVAGAMAEVPGYGGQYGTFECDVTVTDVATARVGILVNADIPDGALYGKANSGQGFYLHHSVAGNGRFVLVDYYNGYRGYAGKDLKSVSPTGDTMLAYQTREKAFLDGETASVTVRLGLRVTPDQIDLMMDGVVIGSYTGEYKTVFSQGAAADTTNNKPAITASTGVGLLAGTAGITFSNFSWTAYTAQS